MATPASSVAERKSTILPPDEARALFDRQARRLLGMSGEEFLVKWDAGEYSHCDLDATPEGRRIAYLIMLIPFGRPRCR
jgi:hypothetical protein